MSAGSGGDLAVLAVGVDAGRLEGFSVESAEDLLGALAHLSDGEIDVICTTLDLPDAQGLDVIRSFREQAGDVPVVVLGTAGVDPQLAFDAGATDVIPAGAPVISSRDRSTTRRRSSASARSSNATRPSTTSPAC